MSEQNIKEEIGKRISSARKTKGLTLKALGELAGNLKQSRLTNWERGTRTPGPEEIKQLAFALNVSPAYLMCLSDDQELNKKRAHSLLIPLLDSQQACDAKKYSVMAHNQTPPDNLSLISVSAALIGIDNSNDELFALKVTDDSMVPEIREDDVLVVAPPSSLNPGDFVVVKLDDKPGAIICQYKKLSFTSSEFELLTLNENWPNIKVSGELDVQVLGKVVQNIRSY